MPCICQYLKRNKKCPKHVCPPSQPTPIDSAQQPPALPTLVTAAEVAALRAELWTLSAELADSTACARNLQDNIANVVQEKYELIDELNASLVHGREMKTQLTVERELHAAERKDLLNEIYFLKGQLDDRSKLFEKVAVQNIELKRNLHEANEKISRLGQMFLKMKFTKDKQANIDKNL